MYFFQAIILTICIGFMLFSSKEAKLIVFILGFLCMNLFSYKIGPLSSAQNMLIFTYCISEWSSTIKSLWLIKKHHIYWLVVIMIIPTIVLIVHSPHYFSLKGAITIFQNEIITKYLGITLQNKSIVCESPYTNKVLNDILMEDAKVFSSGKGKWHNRIKLIKNISSYRWKYSDIAQSSSILYFLKLTLGYLLKRETH